MILYLAQKLVMTYPLLNVVHYVTFRAMAALLSTLFLSIGLGGLFIARFGILLRSKAREYTPESHRKKDDMPTMGGIFILAMVLINVLLWCDLSQVQVWLFLATVFGFGGIGLWDDWHKVHYKKGISASRKALLQLLVAFSAVVGMVWTGVGTQIVFPLVKSWQPEIGPLFALWAMFVLIGTSNAVNLTDGLDGLAINSLLSNFATFGIICYLAGHAGLAAYLSIPFTASSEITVLGGILVGASLGFLWFNTYPAQIFMGDVGSLSLGSALAMMALLSKQELLLAISGGLFVVETVSVIMQVASYKFLGRRMFRMAPIHHHFELLGWPESQITVRFGIISLVLSLMALMTLKVR